MRLFLSLLTLFVGFAGTVTAQETIEPAPADKAVVYLARPSTLGVLINFNFYDGDQLIGRFNGGKYLRYECAPGEHVFWARSENRSFVEATLEAGNIYVIEAIPLMGGIKAQVLLAPVDPTKDEVSKATRKLLTGEASQQFSPEQLAEWADKTDGKTQNGLAQYQQKAEKDRKIAQLTPAMAVSPTALVWEKKSKTK